MPKKMLEGFCPKCAHCQAEAAKEVGVSPTAVLAAATRRSWQQPHYGDGRGTAIVDWFDGWEVGTHATTKDEAIVPPRIIDPQSWLEGFAEGWEDIQRHKAMVVATANWSRL